jgi:hypothetical protein
MIAERDSNSLDSYSSILPLKAFSTSFSSFSRVSFSSSLGISIRQSRAVTVVRPEDHFVRKTRCLTG